MQRLELTLPAGDVPVTTIGTALMVRGYPATIASVTPLPDNADQVLLVVDVDMPDDDLPSHDDETLAAAEAAAAEVAGEPESPPSLRSDA